MHRGTEKAETVTEAPIVNPPWVLASTQDPKDTVIDGSGPKGRGWQELVMALLVAKLLLVAFAA